MGRRRAKYLANNYGPPRAALAATIATAIAHIAACAAAVALVQSDFARGARGGGVSGGPRNASAVVTTAVLAVAL
jgi:hypothetical protein